MVRQKKIQTPKQVVHYTVRTRPNFGASAGSKPIPDYTTLPILRTFVNYTAAVDFVKENGNHTNVYIIESKGKKNGESVEKYVWNSHKNIWKVSGFRQTTRTSKKGNTVYNADATV